MLSHVAYFSQYTSPYTIYILKNPERDSNYSISKDVTLGTLGINRSVQKRIRILLRKR